MLAKGVITSKSILVLTRDFSEPQLPMLGAIKCPPMYKCYEKSVGKKSVSFHGIFQNYLTASVITCLLTPENCTAGGASCRPSGRLRSAPLCPGRTPTPHQLKPKCLGVLLPMEQEKWRDPLSRSLTLILTQWSSANWVGVELVKCTCVGHRLSAVTTGEYLVWQSTNCGSGKWNHGALQGCSAV